jgi:hypothetical protein
MCLMTATCVLNSQTPPPPVLTVTPLTNNLVRLTITNASLSIAYEIHRTPFLSNADYPFQFHTNAAAGVTNFTVSLAGESSGFFKAMFPDTDGDSVPNWSDAAPFVSSVGILTITIDSPTSGQTVE